MAINSTFYLDAADLTLATAVFLDLSLTLIAPDGFYGDGTITRQQSGGILLTAEACATCGTPCGTSISGSGGTGVYTINLDVGSTETGAIVVSMDPSGVPDGMRITYDGVVYNKLSSPNWGVRQSSNPGHYTIVGSIGATSGCGSWYPSGGTITQPIFLYNPATTVFDATGTNQTNTITTDDFFVESGLAGNCVMVIPKLSATPSALLIEIIGPCSGTGWSFSAACPVALPSFFASSIQPTSSIPCTTTINPTPLYFAKVHTAADTFVGLYDYVFIDANGQFPIANGYYLINNVAVPNKVIQVANGVVVAITNCI